MHKIRVAELFRSIQGEGIWLGTPSSFIRASGCNLRCRWCDTPYASWEPEGDMWAVESLALWAYAGPRHVVLTGGEPMLFEGMVPLTAQLREYGRVITIETAGTVFRELDCDLMSISPKLANSTPPPDTPGRWAERHERTRLDLAPAQQLLRRYPCQVKFVIDPDPGLQDFEEAQRWLDQVGPVDPDRVLVMAEGTDLDTLARRERMLVQPCLERGWRLLPRFHVSLFGHTRGT